MQILTLLLAIQGIYLSRQTYFPGDFNILVQIMPAGVSLDPGQYKTRTADCGPRTADWV